MSYSEQSYPEEEPEPEPEPEPTYNPYKHRRSYMPAAVAAPSTSSSPTWLIVISLLGILLIGAYMFLYVWQSDVLWGLVDPETAEKQKYAHFVLEKLRNSDKGYRNE